MGVFEYGEANGSIHFHALIYIPENEMIGELVEKREYSKKRGEVGTWYGNTYFDENFGIRAPTKSSYVEKLLLGY